MNTKPKRSAKGEPMRWLIEHAQHSGDVCLIWPFARRSDGVGHLKFEGHYTPASRVMCRLIHGVPPTIKHHAAHSCGKGTEGCVNPKHLRWATPTENAKDKTIHGTEPRGARHHKAKLTERDVLRIRALSADGAENIALARQFGVSYQAIWDITHRRNWRHVA